jgi:4-hydroxybenzoate polyprenyltransferase
MQAPGSLTPSSVGPALAPTNPRRKALVSDYVRIMRPDHWIKHVLIAPGVVFALIMSQGGTDDIASLVVRLGLILLSAMALSSANYTINEWLDAPFDAAHPIKRSRPAVAAAMSPWLVVGQYYGLSLLGLALASLVGTAALITATVFWGFGIVYNVRPLRAKDRAFVDVIVESVNNPLRFLMGWFAVVPDLAPPVSILIAYWCGGAFLMTAKRISEHRAIVAAGGEAMLAAYRPSFARYTAATLTASAFAYAQGFAFMMAVFIVKYRIEYLVAVPLLVALFVAYMRLAMTPDSAAARPEDLMRQPFVLVLSAVTLGLFAVLTSVDLPWLAQLTSSDLIPLFR